MIVVAIDLFLQEGRPTGMRLRLVGLGLLIRGLLLWGITSQVKGRVYAIYGWASGRGGGSGSSLPGSIQNKSVANI